MGASQRASITNRSSLSRICIANPSTTSTACSGWQRGSGSEARIGRRVRPNVADGWEDTRARERSLEDAVATIEQSDSLVVLKDIERDPVYGPVFGQVVADIAARVGPRMEADLLHGRATMLISSPRRVTAFHIDAEANFLLQLRGEKTVHVFDGSDGAVLSSAELEAFYAGDLNAARYEEQKQAKAPQHRLPSGAGRPRADRVAALGAERRRRLGLHQHQLRPAFHGAAGARLPRQSPAAPAGPFPVCAGCFGLARQGQGRAGQGAFKADAARCPDRGRRDKAAISPPERRNRGVYGRACGCPGISDAIAPICHTGCRSGTRSPCRTHGRAARRGRHTAYLLGPVVLCTAIALILGASGPPADGVGTRRVRGGGRVECRPRGALLLGWDPRHGGHPAPLR